MAYTDTTQQDEQNQPETSSSTGLGWAKILYFLIVIAGIAGFVWLIYWLAGGSAGSGTTTNNTRLRDTNGQFIKKSA